MTVSKIYKEVVIQDIIKSLLFDEIIPTPAAVEAQLEEHEESHDFSEPLHTSAQANVEFGENSSATKYNTTTSNISKDLTVLYRSLLDISNQSSKRYDRWRAKALAIEARIKLLADKISNLLLVEEESAGYFNYIQDDFSNLSKVDLANTTTRIDTKHQHVSIGTSLSSSSVTRIFPLDSVAEKDIEFNILTKDGLITTLSTETSSLKHAIDGLSSFWQERIHTSKSTSMTVELRTKLSSSAVNVSRVDIDLHSSSRGDVIQVLPMYSVDGKSWVKLPLTNFMLSTTDKCSFQFTPTSMLYMKFLFTKTVPDIVQESNGRVQSYVYEFGVDDISFFNEGISTSENGQTLISQVLSVTDPTTKAVQTFSKVSLDACERIEDGDTSIDYYVSASNDSSFSVSSANWMSIDPISRNNPTKPVVVDFGEQSYYSRSGIGISYDALNTTTALIDPHQTFNVLTAISGTTGTVVSATASGQRYSVPDPSFKILDFEMLSSISHAKDSLELWRNIVIQGDTSLIRGRPRGWGQEEDYYKTTVYVSNTNGTKIDFGPSPIIIDDISVTGEYTVSYGSHTVKVHKNNFLEISPAASMTTISLLKAADTLYPYNHRYLVEGFNYPATYPTTDEKVYMGFDVVAEYKMKQVGVVDLFTSTKEDDYERFAIDTDAPDVSRTSSGSVAGTSALKVFAIRVDNEVADFLDEQFYIRFRPVDATYSYLRLRAILKSKDSGLSPFLDGYQLRIGE